MHLCTLVLDVCQFATRSLYELHVSSGRFNQFQIPNKSNFFTKRVIIMIALFFETDTVISLFHL